ncbi:MAG: TolC family protein [Spirochaetia bacterium]|nr:TolC family protein [Spirochaetia bacterium]
MKYLKSAWMVCILIIITTQSLFGLSFEELVENLDNSPAVRKAELSLHAAGLQLESARYPGNSSLSLVPSATARSEENGAFAEAFAEQVEFEARIAAQIPVGLLKSQKLQKISLQENFDLERDNLMYRIDAAFLELFFLYKEAWLAGEEMTVLEAEKRAAEERLGTQTRLFDAGDVSLLSLQSAEDELEEAETALLEGKLKKKITWIELAHASGLQPVEERELEPLKMDILALPALEELLASAAAHSPEISALQNAIAAERREIEAQGSLLSYPTIELSFSGRQQSASLAYDVERASLGLSYGLPLYSYGPDLEKTSRTSNSTETWELGLSVRLPLEIGKSDQNEKHILENSIAAHKLEIEERKSSLELQLRSLYQRYLLSNEELTQAQKSIERARERLETVLSLREEQRATAAEELSAAAGLERARFRLMSAEAGRQESLLRSAEAAYLLRNLVSGMESSDYMRKIQ